MRSSEQTKVLVHAALLCVGCDIPAARKCLTAFPTAKFGEKADYSNFLRGTSISRSGNVHKSTALKYKECTTRAQQKDIERDTGIRFSVLKTRFNNMFGKQKRWKHLGKQPSGISRRRKQGWRKWRVWAWWRWRKQWAWLRWRLTKQCWKKWRRRVK